MVEQVLLLATSVREHYENPVETRIETLQNQVFISNHAENNLVYPWREDHAQHYKHHHFHPHVYYIKQKEITEQSTKIRHLSKLNLQNNQSQAANVESKACQDR